MRCARTQAQVADICYNHSMTIRFRSIFFLFLGLVTVWFLFIERAVLTPFILGALFAYLFNPVVNGITKRIKLPRAWVANIVYFLLMIAVVALAIVATERIIGDFDDIRRFAEHFLVTARVQINNLPDWIRPTVYDVLLSIQKTHAINSASLLPFFPQAISRIISVLIFLVSGYYFLREGNSFVESALTKVPNKYKIDVEILLRKINGVLGGYLRGQVFLIFLMSLVTFVSLTILGVRFSLFLGIFSGFAEIVPIVGPIVAAVVAILVVLTTGTVHFGLDPINGAIIVAVLYFVLRHIEDYFIIPHVMGKITRLSPFVIFFAVVAGGHLWGILGLILAVPIAGIIKIILEYSLDQINKTSKVS